MHLTIRKYRKVLGDKKQLVDLVNRELAPMLSTIDGFIDYYALFADDGTVTSVTVFRDAQGAEESVRTAARWVSETLADLLPEAPEVISGEVFAHRPLAKQKAA